MKSIKYLSFFIMILLVVSVIACRSEATSTIESARSPTVESASQEIPNQEPNSEVGSPSESNDERDQPPDERTPPEEAIAACTELSEGEVCEFAWEKGTETGICEMVQNQLACSPKRGQADQDQPADGKQPPEDGERNEGNQAGYNVEQAISDRAQGMTIAFDALAFLTGDLGSDSFFPPGKLADFWGFQYLRDNDPSEMGHAGDFLTSAALNTLYNLTSEQRAELIALAESQVASINEYGYMRFTLIDAFNRLLEGNLPAGTTGLNEEAVKAYSAELYRLDGAIIYNFAVNFARVSQTLTSEQREKLMTFREEMLGDLMYPTGAYLYSQSIQMPEITNTDFLFGQ